MNKALSLFFLLFGSLIFANDQEILVPLSGESSLIPIYLSDFQNEKTQFSNEYFEKLKNILTFDLNHNGRTHLISRHSENEMVLKHKDCQKAFNANYWNSLNIPHIIKIQITDRKFSATLFSTQTNLMKQWNNFELSGNLYKDRRLIHKIADAIHEALFGIPGIASKKILYAKQIPHQTHFGIKWKSEIWEIDYDGGNNGQLTTENNYCITPIFFPQKEGFTANQFLYVSYRLGQSKIFISSFQRSKGNLFIDLRGNQLLPAISPDKNLIAFISDAGGRADLFVQKFERGKGISGKPIQVYSYPRSVQSSPTFSPDGSKIAFVSDKEGSPRIYLINTPTDAINNRRPKAVCLTHRNRENICPSWSPDGRKLAYSANIKGVRQIMMYDFEKKEEIQLTTGPRHKENPCWATDSFHLVFNTADPSSSELFIMNLNQRKPLKITDGVGKKHYPAWEL